MDKEIKSLLDGEIKSELENLSSLEPGSEKHSTAVESLTKLCKISADKKEVRDRYLRLGLEVASLVLPLMFYAAWMDKGFKFEREGTYTSTTFRGLFNRFRPTR